VTDFPLQSDLSLARELADMADAISMDRFRAADLVVTTKPDMSPVSDADKAVENALRGALLDSRPGDSILGEEFGVDGESTRQWIIDPIDGTKNYVRGVPVWATLIALAVDGVPVVGVVSAPALGKRWWAADGSGAHMSEAVAGSEATGRLSRERRIRVSQVSELADASSSCSGITRWEEAGKLDAYLRLARKVWRTRDYGDMWPYMMVAEGLVDVAGEYDLKPWDMAALIPIVQEAGGRFSSVDGEPGPWHGSALATNGLLHEAALAMLG
jgi:histidinol-phosphatase